MASFADLRQALADTVEGQCPTVNVYPIPSDNVNATTGAFVVGGFTIVPSNNSGGRRVTVETFVAVSARNTDLIPLLDELVDSESDRSVCAAIDADRTLGGTVDYVVVNSAGDYRALDIAGTAYYGATITLEVSC